MSHRAGSRPRWRAAVRPGVLAVSLVVLVASLAGAWGAPASAAEGGMVQASVHGSPFRGGAGARPRVTLRVRLAERATLRVEVLRFGGARVRMLARDIARDAGTWSFRWDGRNAAGRTVPDGPYRLRVTATRGSERVVLERWATKAPGVPWVPAPGSVVVAINPGHGGSDPGARSGGLEEADVNLDIARRTARMLEAAGVVVVMTRTADRDVNRPAVDVDGNGRLEHRDELVARLDIANLARADLTLNIHNNATACRCVAGTQTFVDTRRPWGARNRALGQAVQRSMVRRLRAFQTPRWRVRDRGLGRGSYVSLSGASAASPRPALMPAILGESLFIDHPGDRARLASASVRGAIAAAYYDGVVTWLRSRRFAARYTGAEVPATVEQGGEATVRVRVHATGRDALAGWRLEARVVRRVPVLDGSGRRGTLVGSVRVPRLRPGQARDLAVPITMPDAARDWLITLDLVRGDTRLGRLGIVQPQLPVSTLSP